MGTNEKRVAVWARSFRPQIDQRLLEHVIGRANVAGKKIMRGLVYRSPVDTGAFRGHWFVSFKVAGGIAFSAERVDKNGSSTFTRGLNKISKLPPTFPNIVFYNPTPYGPRLEGGWSGQAPSGIIAPTAAEFRAVQAGGG